MPRKKNTQIVKKQIDSATKEYLQTSLQKMGEILNKPKDDPDKFFPNGIELISLTLKVQEIVHLELKIAGEKGLKNLSEENKEVSTENINPSALEK